MRTSPSRTCLGCRRARPKAWLVRLVRLPSGTVVTDPAARAVGRGAYVCPDAECVERALSRGRLAHAFRRPSEAGPNLAAAVRAAARPGAGTPAREASSGSEGRAAGRRGTGGPLAEAGPDVLPLCDGVSAVGEGAVIAVRAWVRA